AIGFEVHYLVAARVAEYRVDTSDHLLPGQGKRKRGFDGDRVALPEWTGSKFLGEVGQFGIITDIQLRTSGQVDRIEQFLCAVMRFDPRVKPGAEPRRRTGATRHRTRQTPGKLLLVIGQCQHLRSRERARKADDASLDLDIAEHNVELRVDFG